MKQRMAQEIPNILSTLLIGEDPKLIATLAYAICRPRHYLAVLESPRMGRPDADAEIVRRNNAAARLQPKTILLAGPESEARNALRDKFPNKMTHVVENISDLERLGLAEKKYKGEPLKWGRDRIGLGLLQALRSGRPIEFSDKASLNVVVPSTTPNIVVCEEGMS